MDDILGFVLAELQSQQRTKSVRQIAEEAGVSYFTVQKWMRKRRRTKSPRIETVQRLADYFRREMSS